MDYRYDTFNPVVLGEIPPGMRILDVGTGTGALGKHLRARQLVSRLVGIEKDQEMASLASQWYDEMIVADLDADVWGLDESFDVVVCADVLEHLANPVAVLMRLSEHLADRGWFLISIPNVAFVSIRLALLLGKFDYNPRGGILDSTHLRFFTLHGFERVLSEADLSIMESRGYSLVQTRYFWLATLAKIWPTLFAIQFLIKATRSAPG